MRRAILRFTLVVTTLVSAGIDTASAARLFVLTNANQLRRIDDSAPSVLLGPAVMITGLQPGETLVGVDFRPADETLYGLGNSNRLYRIDFRTGVASVVTGADGVTAGPLVTSLNGTNFGFDFNPVTDRIRVTSNIEQNLRLDPSDGVALVGVDTNLFYGPADPNFGVNPDVTASAHSNNFNGATTTQLYGIDTGTNVLVTQTNNAGMLSTVGPLGVDASAVAGFDILPGNVARAALVVGGTAQLYSVSLTTGLATLIGPLGATINGVAAAPPGFTATLAGSAATFTGSSASQAIRIDSSGGLLRHDRFEAGDAGFNSSFDFASGTAGDQTLSAANGTVTINGMGGDDTITIGQPASPAGALGGSLSFNVDGGAGHDLVQIDDSGSLALRNYTLGAGNVIGIFGGLANTSVESVELRAGAGADGFSIGTTTATTTLLGGAGADTFVIANNGGLNGGLLDGEGGNDTLDLSLFTTTVQFEAAATREMFLARVSGAQESSPLSTSPATATLVATLDPGASALAFRMPYRDVAGATITFGQFHAAKTGLNGAPVRSLNGTELNGALVPAGTFFGIWASIDAQPLGAANLSSLRANRIYLNVFTNLFPSGELRGQLIAQGVVGLATGTGGVRNVEILDQSMFANGFE